MFADRAENRRRFLQFLAGSPLLAGSFPAFAEGPSAGVRPSDPITWARLKVENLIKMRTELYGAMQQVGAPTVKHLVPGMVRRAT